MFHVLETGVAAPYKPEATVAAVIVTVPVVLNVTDEPLIVAAPSGTMV